MPQCIAFLCHFYIYKKDILVRTNMCKNRLGFLLAGSPKGWDGKYLEPELYIREKEALPLGLQRRRVLVVGQ
jgi:hypothetical protein